jgi:hypothetical protein
MTVQHFVEATLATAALVLLGHGVYRTWLDQLRRPITLLLWAFLTAIFAGVIGSPPHPRAWWFALPAAVLVWEALRGWTRAPRCHFREGGLAALAAALVCYVLTLSLAAWGLFALGGLSLAIALALVGAGLLLRARHREPSPWRPDDWTHYERRATPRSPQVDGPRPPDEAQPGPRSAPV